MKLLRRLTLTLLALLLVVLIAVLQIASNRIAIPPRNELLPGQISILAEPNDSGMSITESLASDQTPYLLALPHSPLSKTGTLLQEQLRARGTQLTDQLRGTILLLHGFGGSKEDNLRITERFTAAGFACIMPDLPGQGSHPHNSASFGRREVPLLNNLVLELQNKHQLPTNTAVFGISQGGAIALQLAAQHPETFQTVVSLSTFANLAEIIARSTKHNSISKPLLPLVDWNTRLRFGFRPSQISPESAAQHITIPTYLAHGEQDQLIPPSHAQRIFQNLSTPHKKLRLVADANHNNVLAKGHLIYADIVSFLLTHAASPASTKS
ncbi:MAG: alpha/beta fold hydrolase [Verrucomicrobiota bacterium]